jgi:outer membrane protein TolC
VRGHLEEHLQRLESPPEGAETEPMDLFRARHARFELDRIEARAARRAREAEAGLRELYGEDVRPARDTLFVLAADAGEPARAIDEALAANPDVREAELAAEARAHLADVARLERRPLLAIEGRLEYGHASNRDKQDNPFAYEPFNVRSASAALALSWDLSVKQRDARVARAQAEAEAARARARAVRARVRVELEHLHARLAEARDVHEASRRALSTTANWLRVAEENVGLGSASTKELIDSYTAFVQARGAHFEAVHDLDLAVVAWRLALGREPLAEGEEP